MKSKPKLKVVTASLLFISTISGCHPSARPAEKDHSLPFSSPSIHPDPSPFRVADELHRIERQFSGLDEISSFGTTYFTDVVQARMLPRGSAMITPSGNLSALGITRIIHAASGSSINTSEHFIPTLEGVSLSVNNALRLAREHHINRVAIPFIGRDIFLKRIGATAHTLAETIIRAALENRENIEVCFVILGPNGPASDFQLFQTTFQNIHAEPAFQHIQHQEAQVIQGNILDFAAHQASAIVNAANMEVRFGGGISGAIATAAGASHSRQINLQAQQLIQHFNERASELLSP